MSLSQKYKKISGIFKLAEQAFGRYKWHLVILTILGFLSGILGGIGINAIIPLFSFVIGGETRPDDPISGYIREFFGYLGIDFAIKYLLLFIVCLFAIKALVLFLFSFIEVRITFGYEKQTRSRLFKKTLEAKWPYLLNRKLGHLEKLLMVNVENSRNLLSQLSVSIRTLTTLIAYTFVALNISAFITLITFGLGSSLFFVFKPLIRRIRKVSYQTEQINRDIAHYINENILGLKTIKAMGVKKRIGELGKEYFDRIRKIIIKAHLLGVFSSVLIEPLTIIFVASIFTIYYKTSIFNFASLAAVIYLSKQIFSYITELQNQLMSLNSAFPYLKRVLDYEKEVIANKERDEGKEPFQFNHLLEFRGVAFSYERGGEVLSEINFKIRKGEMVGLIGPSGAGKTTIVDLILRLFEPSKGKILLDGKEINKISLPEWRKNIGYVAQDIFLLNDTIANNIRFYDQSIDEAKILRAAKMADIYDFVQSCPSGFETIVGERGVEISAGQRQRLVIARVLARNPKFLILDEATSSLDNESEKKIQQILIGLKGTMTMFVIAHRLSTVLNSDRLLVLESGKIIEEGLPDKLLRDKKSYFSKVYHLKE